MSLDQNIEKGTILLAEPFLVDPNFKRSAVLLCEHEQEGSLGFILNKSLDMNITELIADFPDIESKVFYGGPVQTDTIHYIHNVGELLDDSLKVVPGVFWGGNFEKLKALISQGMVQSENIRFYVGYSGWSKGQLSEEMATGSWVTAEMYANYIFKENPKDLWSSVLNNKGDVWSVIAQMPDSVSHN